MSRYFTKQDRENMVKVSTIEGSLGQIIDNMHQYNRPKEWLRPLRTAKTWIGKANQLMAEECSEEELKKLWKYFEKHDIRLMPTSEAKQYANEQGLVMVDQQAVYDMAESLLETACKGCKIVEHDACKYKAAMSKCGVATWEEPDNGSCPYAY